MMKYKKTPMRNYKKSTLRKCKESAFVLKKITTTASWSSLQKQLKELHC